MMGGLARERISPTNPLPTGSRPAARPRGGYGGQSGRPDPHHLEFVREADIAEALARFDEIENAGRLPKSAARRIDSARQQLLGS